MFGWSPRALSATRTWRTVVGLASLLSSVALSSGAARAATYTVTTTVDDFRTGSLRTAINSANSTLADDDIVFAASGTGTIIVSNSAGGSPSGFTINSVSSAGKLTISNTQTNGVTLSGNNTNQIFILNQGANLSLTRLTISGGKGISFASNPGGAVSVGTGATLGINNCTFSGNTAVGSAGAIYNNGTLSIAGSTFSGNSVTSSSGGGGGPGGGAIVNTPVGNLSISNSSFANNTSAFNGGAISSFGSTVNGISSFGTISITGSTFLSNSAPGTVGTPTGNGGAIYSVGTLTLTNSTFSGNTTSLNGGAIFQSTPPNTNPGQKRPVLNVSSTTIAGNTAGTQSGSGSGIYNRATLNLFNSIVAGNTGGGTNPNLFNATTANPPAVFNDGGNNITTGDPLLDALADNGGPTLTRAPQTGSPALNTGATTLPTDQRGVPRPQGSAPDIGAVEVAGPFVVTSLADNTTADGVTTLREAMIAANATTTAETITFAVSGTLTLSSLLPTISNVGVGGALTISNPQSAGVTISGANTFRIFTSSSGANLTLNRLTISGGNGAGSNGGAIANLNAALTITNCTFSGNTTGAATSGGATAGSGGAISNTSTTTPTASTVTASNSTFASNTAASAGAIFNIGGTFNLTNCTVSGNNATGSAGTGGISNSSGPFNLNNSIVAGNTTNFSGGGPPNTSGQVSGSRNLTSGTVSGTGNINSNTPNLGPLADNGGPTFTFLPLSNSAAINAGNGTGPDQRGIARPQGSAPDIGSVEVVPPNIAPVNTLPVAQSADEDTPIILSQDAGTLISIADGDAGSGILSVELRPVNGRISFNTGAATNPSDFSGVTLEGNVVKLLRGTVANLNAALRNLTFTPIKDFVGLATLQITTNDNGNSGLGGAKTDSDTLNLTFNEGNDPPVALNDSYATSQDSTLTVSAAGGVLKNDSDPDSPRSALSAVLDTAPTNAASGGFTLNADGSFTYTPATGFFGSDVFTYHVSDGSLSSAIARVRISIAQTEATILDVSTQVDVTRLGVRYDFSLAAYTQEIVLTNNGAAITNPIYLVLDNLTGATLTNKTGNIQNFDTSGSPYILVANSLGAGASTSIVLQFDDSSVSYDTRVLTGTTPP